MSSTDIALRLSHGVRCVNVSTVQTPPACPETLSPEQRTQFLRDGYLAFRAVLSPTEVDSARDALSALIQKNARAPGTLARLQVQFEPGTAPTDLTDELKVRKLMWFCNHNPFLHDLAHTHARIQGVIASIIGPAPILFQEMALIKPPFVGGEKPWHQDNAYFAVSPLEAVLGVWIALDDATVANGCMHVLAGEHTLGPRRHHHDRDCEIVPSRLDASRATPVELPAGGAMFFAGLLPHQTPPNTSPNRRRALQFHYRGAASRAVSREEYDRIYAEADGTPASCAAAPPKH